MFRRDDLPQKKKFLLIDNCFSWHPRRTLGTAAYLILLIHIAFMDETVDHLEVENVIYYYQCSELTMPAYTRRKLRSTPNSLTAANDDVITF